MHESEYGPKGHELSVGDLVDEIFAKPSSHLESAIQLTDRVSILEQELSEAMAAYSAGLVDGDTTSDEKITIAWKKARYLMESRDNAQAFVDWHLKHNARQEKIDRIKARVGSFINLRGLFFKSGNNAAAPPPKT